MSPEPIPRAPLGLYVHVPFCASICRYCTFTRDLFDTSLKDRYLRALGREIRDVADCLASDIHPATGRPLGRGFRGTPARADTLYFGGGTPSLLTGEEVPGLIADCRERFDLADDAEITLEANPETVTYEAMAAWRRAGVNRISLGVQSLRDEELRRLGRLHDAARAREALEATRAAGVENVSLDLMLGLPRQSVDDCLVSVRTLAVLGPAHASLYLLEVHPGSPLEQEMARSGWSPAPDEAVAEMYLRAIDVLDEAGYQHYEICNFARPGRQARHNRKYWTDGEWLAFGPGAHSTVDGVRWKNDPSITAYADALEHSAGPAIVERRELTAAERFEEAMFMGLRLVQGVDLDEIRSRYGVDVWDGYGDRLTPFVEAGLLACEGRRLRLTPRGLLLSNDVMTVFIRDAGTVK